MRCAFTSLFTSATFAILATLAPLPAHAQWQIEQSNSTASLRGISTVSEQIAWASGTSGTVLRTIDGGTTWTRCAIPPDAETLDFRAIRATSTDRALAMSAGPGKDSRLYLTTDACKSWSLLLTNPDAEGFWDGLIANDSLSDALIIGDPVNGHFAFFSGKITQATWQPTTQPNREIPTPHSHDEGLYAASNSIFAGSGVHNFSWITGGKNGSYFYEVWWQQSWDALTSFNTLRKIPLAASPSAGAFSMAKGCANGNKDCALVVVGGDYKLPDATKATAAFASMKSAEYAPEKFQAAKTMPHGYRSAVAFDATSKAFIAVGPNGTDISRDFGKHWQPLKPASTEATDADRDWNALELPFVVGPHGRIGKLNPQALTGH